VAKVSAKSLGGKAILEREKAFRGGLRRQEVLRVGGSGRGRGVLGDNINYELQGQSRKLKKVVSHGSEGAGHYSGSVAKKSPE